MRSRVIAVSFAALVVIAAGQCGGRIMDGYFDSDGSFHASDGAVVFGPGSSCKDYDASALADSSGWQNGELNTGVECSADGSADYCHTALPPGLFFPVRYHYWNESSPFYELSCTNGTCRGEQIYNVPCPGTGSDGDHYCRQFFQQFVAAAGAVAVSSCRPCAEVDTAQTTQCGDTYVCAADCCPQVAHGFCVQRTDAAPSCDEYPCKP